jgi:N6-adenosine-specific RNA methylase IME4
VSQLVTVDAETGEILPADSSAQEINTEHRLARASAEDAVQHAIRCGELLTKQKPAIGHGKFTSWVESNCEFGIRRAQAYMKAYAKNDPRIAFQSVRELLAYNEEAEPQHRRIPDPPPSNGCAIGDLSVLGDASFGTIYADPPWLYGNQGTRAATGNHYGGMTVQQICDLPIARLAAEQAHLHLWTTNAFLFDARQVMEAWGFTYKSCFVWVKPQMGIGNYWRVSHEFMLLGVRGSLPFADKSLKSWSEIPRGRHSAKPEQVREFIERASPGPYLELFARRAVEGWACWGNEVHRDVFAA